MKKFTELEISTWKVNRQAWVKALRSGDHKQGIGKLLSDDGSLCCLGVLSIVAGMKAIRKDGKNCFGSEWSVAPLKAMRAVGLFDNCGTYYDKKGGELFLTVLNDRGVSFSRIADIIESEPDELFRG